MIISGGAAINQDIIDMFDAIGITILNGYGITECSPLVSCNRNKYQKKGSVGIPIIGEQIKIKDPDENGEGEICVKGPNVMLGYYKNPEATAQHSMKMVTSRQEIMESSTMRAGYILPAD